MCQEDVQKAALGISSHSWCLMIQIVNALRLMLPY